MIFKAQSETLRAMNGLIFIALGGAIGAVARYGVSQGMARVFGHGFPYGTLTVNVVGSLIMGMVVGFTLGQSGLSDQMRLFLMVGVLGAFTTFSTFSMEAVSLIEKGHLQTAFIYIASSVILSLLGFWGGLSLFRSGVIS